VKQGRESEDDGRRLKLRLLGLVAALLVGGCASFPLFLERSGPSWGPGAFDSNGERIYFSGTSERSGRIIYRGGPTGGGMMMGGGSLACVSCHGPDGRGGVHGMHMQVMDAPDIRWSTLSAAMEEGHGGEAQPEGEHGEVMAGYDLEAFRLAVVEGRHPDGTELSSSMPRWNLSDEDLADLAEFLQSLP